MQIEVDDAVREMVLREKHDFRVCTACLGPALVSTEVKPFKESDVKIPVGDYTIYVSSVQAPYIERITMDMLYDEEEIDSCPAFYNYTAAKRNSH
jgi:Fe-S cluster assembly iron-binding protein IscA